IAGSNELPMLLGKIIESQAGLQITAKTIHGGGINLFIFGHKADSRLLGFLAVGLVKDGLEFGINLSLLLLWEIAQYVCHFVFDAALALGGGELVLNRIDHRFATIGDP